MFSAIHVRRVGVQVRTHHPADFAMFHRTFANELHPRSQNKIAVHFVPDKMALIIGEPHVDARARNGVVLFRRIVACCAGKFRRTDVRLAGKFTGRIHL